MRAQVPENDENSSLWTHGCRSSASPCSEARTSSLTADKSRRLPSNCLFVIHLYRLLETVNDLWSYHDLLDS